MSKDEDEELELPETPPIQMVTETFSQYVYAPESQSNNNEQKNDGD